MDGNKDEPVKCFKIGEAALKDFKLVNHPAWDLSGVECGLFYCCILVFKELEEEKDISYWTVQPQMKKVFGDRFPCSWILDFLSINLTEVTLAEKRHARFIHEEYKEKIWLGLVVESIKANLSVKRRLSYEYGQLVYYAKLGLVVESIKANLSVKRRLSYEYGQLVYYAKEDYAVR
ncbi:hypothetical protein C5167_044025 [Papaver somniferum]|uniref:Uncharacterized protein n=1 Tax=Papaver somniferum TaxID=3469 RepID=A0A4Y7LB99_PAPSO|nr:hypothetical protein C5167_044025 [Papaver somniferum]